MRNKEFIETEIHQPEPGQRFYRHEDIAGFAIRATRKSKAYILEKRVGGSTRRMTIGKCSEMSLESARKQACIMLGEIENGNDPRTGKRINTLSDITLREVLQKFLEIKPIRQATKQNYVSAINCHFQDWLDKPITSLTKDMVEQRHQDLTIAPNRLGQLNWSFVDFENKILNVPRELTKCDREHRLPLSDFLLGLLKRRYMFANNSQWVFPSVRNSYNCISSGSGLVRRVRAKSGIKFSMHDLRRTFLTMGEKLEVPPYVLKKLVNHSVNDITGRYLVLDIERLRQHMSLITDGFLKLLNVQDGEVIDCHLQGECDFAEVTQLRITFEDDLLPV